MLSLALYSVLAFAQDVNPSDPFMDVTFINEHEEAATIWWMQKHDDSWEYHPKLTLQTGERETMRSIPGHTFVVTANDKTPSEEAASLARFIIHEGVFEYIVHDDHHIPRPVRFKNRAKEDLELWIHDGFEAHPQQILPPGSFWDTHTTHYSTYMVSSVGAAQDVKQAPLCITQDEWIFNIGEDEMKK